jgi:hypothetical protein
MDRVEPKTKEQVDREPLAGTTVEAPPVSKAMADYAASLKSLTNYEVWKRVESMILTLTPGQELESEVEDWWRFRVLLDELQWRLSGLEGARVEAARIHLAA